MMIEVRRVLIAGLLPIFATLNACSDKQAEEPVTAPSPAEEIPSAPAAPAAPEAPEAPLAPEAPAKKKAKVTKKKVQKPTKK
jgi:hypothetical protein